MRRTEQKPIDCGVPWSVTAATESSRAMRSPRRSRGRSNIEAEIPGLVSWVWTVAFRLAAAELRRPSLPENVAEDKALDAELPDLVRALRELPPKQRLAVVLHDYADRPTREVAAVLGASTATVRVHLSQGRRRLRGLLEERHA